MQNLTSLFLSQSYEDTWDDYNRSLTSKAFPSWDYIILTASDKNQAEGFRRQIKDRKGFLPIQTRIVVLPDEEGIRVGSGGATLSVLKYIYEKEQERTGKGHFDKLRILVIHSGGDSKRVPAYSALGKLFSPVPHKLPNGKSSTLFDELLIAMASVPSRIREGMVLLSGDVLLLFNPLQIDFSGKGAAAISFKEHVNTGKDHGVFLNGENGNVKRFLHKQTIETLNRMGAVNENGCVDIDTGAIIFSPEILDSLYELIETVEGYKKYVNAKVRLSLYGDFLYPLAEDSTREAFYREQAEGEVCSELIEARTAIWQKLRPYRMKLLRLAPAKFIHFGTTKEILALMSGDVDQYKALSWSKKVNSSILGDIAGYNSVLSRKALVGKNCYLEVSYVHSQTKIGNRVILSHIDVNNVVIPDEVVLHGLKQKNGKFVCRIYGILDNPKESKIFGMELSDIITELGITESELWDSDNHTLWMAKLYSECDSIKEAVDAALNFYAVIHKKGKVELWKKSIRKSLCSGFHDADADAIITWNRRMRELVQMDEIIKEIDNKIPAKSLTEIKSLTKIQKEWIKKRYLRQDVFEKMRLQYYLGTVLNGKEGNGYITECFDTISHSIQYETREKLHYDDTCKIIRDIHVVKLPLRVNWGGGWSDTPPICCETGGTVLNASIRLNGELPVEVTVIKITENKIIFDSRDMDVHGEFDSIELLQQTGNPYDPFALQKACLLACGIIPKEGGNLKEILSRLGGGFEIHSEVKNVPKGSGLGTSSILSAACVKAILEFMGIAYTNEDLYERVLVMEQIMSTGGGWQDQVGGVTNGIKYITSKPGLQQKLNVEHVIISEETRRILNERFCLIYTGQRRLARNLLRDVVGRYIGNEPESLFALNEIQRVAVLMRFELERGNIDEFARLLGYHWELSKKIDRGSSNTLIEQIFTAIDYLIDGKMVCGAGGGGFLQVILKEGVKKEEIHRRLKEVFQDNPVDIWDCEII